MGGGRWDDDTYRSVTGAKIASGTSFGYSSTTKAKPATTWAAHATLDPKKVAGPTSPFAGTNTRESRDSDEHPLSTPVILSFDQTGSMGHVPVALQKKLAEIFGLLQRKSYVDDPQIMVGAYGDAEVDRVPLQMGEFESDNRIDESLDNLFLEGNGGGNFGESVTLAWYFAATHTATDAWDKRGKKGYLFTIGDEVPLPTLTRDQIKQFTGDDVQADLSPSEVLSLARERWDVYHVIIENGTAVAQGSKRRYTELLGDHAIVLQDPETVAEVIAALIGIAEGRVDLDDLEDDMKDVGVPAGAIASTTKAVATRASGSGGRVVVADTPGGDLDVTDDSGDSVERV